jgi:uncharacterized membrane protein AbrB (regulator of aidB expression)
MKRSAHGPIMVPLAVVIAFAVVLAIIASRVSRPGSAAVVASAPGGDFALARQMGA